MKNMTFYKKFASFNIFIIITLLLLGFSVFYFLYNRERSQAEVFVKVSLVRPKEIFEYNAPYYWLPYWIGESVGIGDKELSPFGGLNVQVVEKEVLEGRYAGQIISLLLKIRTVRDRTGVYLFKNKPLSVGAIIDLKLAKSQLQGFITYVGKDKPIYDYHKIIVSLKGKGIESWIADNVQVGSTIADNKGRILAKVLEKKVTPAETKVDTTSGQAVISYNKTLRDLLVKLEILVYKINNIYYFTDFQKVKVDEYLYLPLKEVSLAYPVISVSEPVQ